MSGYNQFPGSAGGVVKFTVNSNMAKGEKRQKNSEKMHRFSGGGMIELSHTTDIKTILRIII